MHRNKNKNQSIILAQVCVCNILAQVCVCNILAQVCECNILAYISINVHNSNIDCTGMIISKK